MTVLKEMFLGWGTVALVYFSLGWYSPTAVVIPELWLDQQLSFTPSALWLYLSFFILIPVTYFKVHADDLLHLRYAMQISAIISGLFFLFLPSQLVYPQYTDNGISSQWLALLVAFDTHQNCFPSLHASLTTICVMMLVNKQRLFRSMIMVLFGIAIGVSIIKLRRHLTIDVGGGVVVGVCAYFLAGVLKTKLKGTR